MKILTLILAVAFLTVATTVFAAIVYWGHPYMGGSHHQSGPYMMGDTSGVFGGCPYLQQLHKEAESNGGIYSYHGLPRGFDFFGNQDRQEPFGDSIISPPQKPIEI